MRGSTRRVGSGSLHRISSLGLALWLVGCGGSTPEDAEAPRAWGLPSGAPKAVPVESADVVVIFAIDKVIVDELWTPGSGVDEPGGDGLPRAEVVPHISGLARGSLRALDAITTSTTGNGAMGSLLTGLHPLEHGVLSLKEPSRVRLSGAAETLAEGFQAAGWTTIFSSGNPRHARGFSGFSQGFETFEAPRLGEDPRPAPAVANGALRSLERALAGDDKVFAVLSFDDLRPRTLEAPTPEEAAPFLERRLAPLAPMRADIEALLVVLDANPEKGLEGLTELLSRARGSAAATAFQKGLRDAHLARIDAAVGEVLQLIDESGRTERAMIALTGLRGTTVESGHQAGPRFRPEVVGIPLFVHLPGAARAGETLGETASLLDVPRFLGCAAGLELPVSQFRAQDLAGASGAHGAALVLGTGLATMAAIDSRIQLERYVDGQTVPFDRRGAEITTFDKEARARVNAALIRAIGVARSEWTFGPGYHGAEPIELDWKLAGGAALLAEDKGAAPRLQKAVRGTMTLTEGAGAGGGLPLWLDGRGASGRFELRTEGDASLDPSKLRFGARSGAELALLLAPHRDMAPAGEDAAAPRVKLVRTDGYWWTLEVGQMEAGPGGSKDPNGAPKIAELLVTVWPPRDPGEELEVTRGLATSVEAMPGRADAFHIVGEVPFTCRVKKVGKEDFLLAAAIDGDFVPPAEIEVGGLRLGAADRFAFVLPAWLESPPSDVLTTASDALARQDVAGEYGGSAPAPGVIRVSASDYGLLPEAGYALGPEDLKLLQRLLPGE